MRDISIESVMSRLIAAGYLTYPHIRGKWIAHGKDMARSALPGCKITVFELVENEFVDVYPETLRDWL